MFIKNFSSTLRSLLIRGPFRLELDLPIIDILLLIRKILQIEPLPLHPPLPGHLQQPLQRHLNLPKIILLSHLLILHLFPQGHIQHEILPVLDLVLDELEVHSDFLFLFGKVDELLLLAVVLLEFGVYCAEFLGFVRGE